MKRGNFVKLIGLKFDVLEGIEIISDSNVSDFKEAGERAEKHNDDHTIFIGIPCEYTYGR